MKLLKRLAAAALGVAAVSGAVLVAAPSAQAATAGNGVCESGEFCLYFKSDQGGSLRDFSGSVRTYGTGSSYIKFVGRGEGQGRCVKNDAASAWNRKSVAVTVFRKSNWAGSIDSYIGGAKANLLAALKNNNAGHVVGRSDNGRMETALYQSTAGGITSYFDGYLSSPFIGNDSIADRHEGIDLAKGSGSPVHALLPGVVTNKVEGGGSSLSTLAIYNASLDKTIIYLHTDPLVSVGQRITIGQRIALEAARGAGSAVHTHVEMRDRRQTNASKSVDDPVLDNDIPTSFWMARGYNICCQ